MWSWFPLPASPPEAVYERLRALPHHVSVRAGDAIHLLTAQEHGLAEVYNSDRNMLGAARHFGPEGVDVVGCAAR